MGGWTNISLKMEKDFEEFFFKKVFSNQASKERTFQKYSRTCGTCIIVHTVPYHTMSNITHEFHHHHHAFFPVFPITEQFDIIPPYSGCFILPMGNKDKVSVGDILDYKFIPILLYQYLKLTCSFAHNYQYYLSGRLHCTRP